MKIRSWFLKILLVLISAAVIMVAIFLLPLSIHRLVTSTPQSLHLVGFIFAIGAYLLIISFLVAVIFAEQLLHVIDHQQQFSQHAIHLLAAIKWCMVSVSLGALLWLPLCYNFTQLTDAPGILIIGLAVVAIPITVTVFLSLLQHLWTEAVARQQPQPSL